jgi:hypothetical protein
LPKYSKNTPVSVLPLFGRFAAGSFMATDSSGVGFVSDTPMNARSRNEFLRRQRLDGRRYGAVEQSQTTKGGNWYES